MHICHIRLQPRTNCNKTFLTSNGITNMLFATEKFPDTILPWEMFTFTSPLLRWTRHFTYAAPSCVLRASSSSMNTVAEQPVAVGFLHLYSYKSTFVHIMVVHFFYSDLFFYVILTYSRVTQKTFWAKFLKLHKMTDRFFNSHFFHEIARPGLMRRIPFSRSIGSFLFSQRLGVTMETYSELKWTRVLQSWWA